MGKNGRWKQLNVATFMRITVISTEWILQVLRIHQENSDIDYRAICLFSMVLRCSPLFLADKKITYFLFILKNTYAHALFADFGSASQVKTASFLMRCDDINIYIARFNLSVSVSVVLCARFQQLCWAVSLVLFGMELEAYPERGICDILVFGLYFNSFYHIWMVALRTTSQRIRNAICVCFENNLARVCTCSQTRHGVTWSMLSKPQQIDAWNCELKIEMKLN